MFFPTFESGKWSFCSTSLGRYPVPLKTVSGGPRPRGHRRDSRPWKVCRRQRLEVRLPSCGTPSIDLRQIYNKDFPYILVN